jgi:hypothetical protein
LQFLSKALCRVAAELPKNFLLEDDELVWFHYHLLTGGKLSTKSTYQITNFDKCTGILVASHMYCLIYFSKEEFKEEKAGCYFFFKTNQGRCRCLWKASLLESLLESLFVKSNQRVWLVEPLHPRTPDMIVRLGNKNKEGRCSLLQVRVSPYHPAFPPAHTGGVR